MKWLVTKYETVEVDNEDGFEVSNTEFVGSIRLEDDEQYDDAALTERLMESGFIEEEDLDVLVFNSEEFQVWVLKSGRPELMLESDR